MDYKKHCQLENKLKKVSSDLNKLLIDIRKYYPEANYMVEGGVISVIYDAPCGEKYSENGVFISSDTINNLDCGLWN